MVSVSTRLHARQMLHCSTWEEPVLNWLWGEKPSFNQLYERFWINSLNFSLCMKCHLQEEMVFYIVLPASLSPHLFHGMAGIPNPLFQTLQCRVWTALPPEVLSCIVQTFWLTATSLLLPLGCCTGFPLSPSFPLLPPPMAQPCVLSDTGVPLYFMFAVSRYEPSASFSCCHAFPNHQGL